jgi:hypothetical protein
MIRINAMEMENQLKAGLKALAAEAKSGETKRAIATCLQIGLKAVEKKAKLLAKPKKKKRKRRGFTSPYKRTGLLRKSYKVKKGVSKKGKGNPYAVLGPDKKVSKTVLLGKQMVKVTPSKYAHLVEFGFMLKHRKRLKGSKKLLGHDVELFKPQKIRKGTFRHTINQFAKKANDLSRGFIFKAYAAILSAIGSGSTWVQPQYIIKRAYQQAGGEMKTLAMQRIGLELGKLVMKVTKRNVKKRMNGKGF